MNERQGEKGMKNRSEGEVRGEGERTRKME